MQPLAAFSSSPPYFPELRHLEARQLRAAAPPGGVSCSTGGAASGALLSPSSSVTSSCTLPSSSSSLTCSCWTSVRRRPSGPECRSSCSTSGSSAWCWRNSDRWSSKPWHTFLLQSALFLSSIHFHQPFGSMQYSKVIPVHRQEQEVRRTAVMTSVSLDLKDSWVIPVNQVGQVWVLLPWAQPPPPTCYSAFLSTPLLKS